MYYYRAWSEPQPPPPPPPQPPPPPPPTQTAGVGVCISHTPPPRNQHYPVPLPYNPQPQLYSPYPTNPSPSYSHSNPIPIQWNPATNTPYAPHGGYASANYPCAGEGASATAAAVAVDGVYSHGVEESRSISATEAIRQDGGYTVGYVAAPPNCYLVSSALPHQNSFNPLIPSMLPQQNAFNPSILKSKRKAHKKVTKIPQALHCGVCKLDCNSQDALKSHKLGKKHLKNLQKLQDSITLKPTSLAKITSKDGEEQSKETKRKSVSIPESEDEIKTKKIRVLESGASADDVRVCSICNVVVNSQKVFLCHLAGQKHQEMLKKVGVC